MAAKMELITLHLRTFLLLIWTAADSGDGYSCPYGQSCSFEPAPPGRAPACAQPGLTYCVHPEPYPEYTIRMLIEAGQYDTRTLLTDESRDNYNSLKGDYPYGYGPNSLPHVDQISLVNDIFSKNYNTKFHSSLNPEIYSQKTPLQPPSPVDSSPYNINAYQTQNFTKTGFHGYQTSPAYWNNYNSYDKLHRQNLTQTLGSTLGVSNQNDYYSPSVHPNDGTGWSQQAATGVTRYSPREWWKYILSSHSDVTMERVTFPFQKRRKRNAELVKAAAKRPLSGAEALRIALGLASAETSAERPRRQAGVTLELCRTRTEFITPRAALNNRGAWRYVVNMPANMTQLVRAEICMSTECNGICSLPLGYTSRCQQKYIQKRLVALEANGQNLYTDLFWIPSCCQCSIVNNDQ